MRLVSFSILVTALAATFVNAASFADLAAQIPACDVSQLTPIPHTRYANMLCS
jgi:hypothetical protein